MNSVDNDSSSNKFVDKDDRVWNVCHIASTMIVMCLLSMCLNK
jgi:hypothetical protein